MKIWVATQTALVLQMLANLANGKSVKVPLDNGNKQWDEANELFNGSVCIYFRQEKNPNLEKISISHQGNENQDTIAINDYLAGIHKMKFYFDCRDLEENSKDNQDCTKTDSSESSKENSFTEMNPSKIENNSPSTTDKPGECDPRISEELSRHLIVIYVLAALLFVSALLNSSLGTYVCCLARRHKNRACTHHEETHILSRYVPEESIYQEVPNFPLAQPPPPLPSIRKSSSHESVNSLYLEFQGQTNRKLENEVKELTGVTKEESSYTNASVSA